MSDIYEATLKDAIALFGVQAQTIKAMEELAELAQALSKTLLGYTNGDNLREEIADVEIMLSQLRIMYDVENGDGSVDDVKEYKIERLRHTIETKRARMMKTKEVRSSVLGIEPCGELLVNEKMADILRNGKK